MELGKRIFIIAEIGINHNGSMQYAKELIGWLKIVVAMLLNSKELLMLFIKEFLESPDWSHGVTLKEIEGRNLQ